MIIRQIPALKTNIEDMAAIWNKIAVVNKDFAETLVARGLDGDITPEFVRKTILEENGKDFFDPSGELTKEAKNMVKKLIFENKLSKNATWQRITEAENGIKPGTLFDRYI